MAAETPPVAWVDGRPAAAGARLPAGLAQAARVVVAARVRTIAGVLHLAAAAGPASVAALAETKPGEPATVGPAETFWAAAAECSLPAQVAGRPAALPETLARAVPRVRLARAGPRGRLAPAGPRGHRAPAEAPATGVVAK